MPDEIKLQQAEVRAVRAQQLLENELLIQCFEQLKADYLDQWKKTSVMQTDVREKYWLALRVVDVVQDHLNTIIANGKLARADLRELALKNA